MAAILKRARIELIITSMTSCGGRAPRTTRIAAGGNSLPEAFDEAALVAIFAVGALLGLAAYQATQPAKREGVRILALPLHADRFHSTPPSQYHFGEERWPGKLADVDLQRLLNGLR
jgi:hypothetical protein